jgi:xylulose-5-phosphate/fructose-6-phosphate phosphoketolase
VVNVVNLMKLQPPEEHPHGLSHQEFDAIFTKEKPINVAFHGYPWLIHRLTYRRTNHQNLHVRGYKEEGTTTTPFDMAVLNQLDRFSLVSDVIDRVPKLGERAAYVQQAIREKLIDHKNYIARHGDDMPEVREWMWPGGATADTAADQVRPTGGRTPRIPTHAVRWGKLRRRPQGRIDFGQGP